jgi:hypothetical protein
MADWQAFATAFLTDTAGYINDRKDKAEDYADELREQADRNKGKLQKLRAAAKAQQGFISQAKGLHASNEQIEAALDAGPAGVQTLVGQLSKLQADFGAGYDAELVSEYAKLPDGFKASGNIDPLARYGLTGQEVGDTAKPEGGWWQKAMGKDAMARTRYEADQQMTGSGMSIYDMAELDSVAGYDSMNGSSFLSYVQPKRFNPTKKVAAHEALTEVALDATRTPGYAAFDDQIAAAGSQYEDPAKKAAAVAKIKEEQRQYVNDFVGIHVDSQVELYGQSYLDAMTPMLNQLGFTVPVQEMEAGAVGTGSVEPAAVNTAKANNEIITTDLPKIVSRTKIKGRDFTLLDMDGEIRYRDEETGEVLSVEDTEKARQMYEEGYAGVAADSMAALGLTPEFKTGRNKGREDKPSAEAPEEQGYQPPTMGATELNNPKVKNAKSKKASPKGVVSEAPEVAESDVSVEASPRSEALIQKFGKDILAYFRESGLTKDDDEEDFKAVLADWYGENSANKELISMSTGADDGSIIYVMRMMLDGGS